MPKQIEHISASFINAYENYRDDFIDGYILGKKKEANKYMEFGKDYEDILAENEYKDYNRQEELRLDFE
jgi:hypothetical protein